MGIEVEHVVDSCPQSLLSLGRVQGNDLKDKIVAGDHGIKDATLVVIKACCTSQSLQALRSGKSNRSLCRVIHHHPRRQMVHSKLQRLAQGVTASLSPGPAPKLSDKDVMDIFHPS